MAAPEHPNELERLRTLADYDIDTAPDALFERIAQLAAAVCTCPTALVTVMGKERQWFKAAVAFDLEELSREISFCAHAVASGETLVVEDALQDERFFKNPLVISSPKIRFYAGVPYCASNGLPLGTICELDKQPRTLSELQREALLVLAREVESQISTRRALARAALSSNQQAQLVAMLVHDVRNPLQVALSEACMLAVRHADSAEAAESLEHLTGALHLVQRMTLNLLDVWSGEAGQLRVARGPVGLSAPVTETAALARGMAMGQTLEVATTLAAPVVDTDRELVRRVLENLLGNAFKYSPSESVVRLEVRSSADGSVSLRVADEGPGVPESERETIFAARARLDRDTAQHARASYGLGLTFCRIAVTALGGRIWIEAGGTSGAVFCVELPGRRAGVAENEHE